MIYHLWVNLRKFTYLLRFINSTRRSKNKSQDLNSSRALSVNKDEEEKQKVNFDLYKQHRRRLFNEKHIKRIAEEKPEMLHDKTKDIIRRIETKQFKRTNQLASLSQDSRSKYAVQITSRSSLARNYASKSHRDTNRKHKLK